MTRLASLNAIVHLVGLGLAVGPMRHPYMEHAPSHARLWWKLSWAWWAMAAGVLMALMIGLARRDPSRMALTAVALAGIALCNDLVADYVWIFHYPQDPEWHRFLVIQGAVIANALYSAAVLCIGFRLKRLTLLVFSCGMLFSISAAFRWRLPTMAFSGATILLYSYWGLVMARPVAEE